MKKLIVIHSMLFVLLSIFPCRAFAYEDYMRIMKQDLLALMVSYPEHIVDVERDEHGFVYIVMKSGKKIIYDDKIAKSAAQRLENADLQDTLQEAYPLGETAALMKDNKDPGRYRSYELLQQVYGKNRGDIEKRLKSTGFVYGRVLFNSSNNASSSLEKAGDIILPLMYEPKVSKAVHPGSGTYNYRVIAGTSHLSPHAYGIAIDLARDSRDYWQWAAREDGAKRLKDYPPEVVKAFEDNGFIWGGKWWHFDILHFEYRPEIIFKAKYFIVPASGEWYQSAPLELAGVKEYIQKINKALE